MPRQDSGTCTPEVTNRFNPFKMEEIFTPSSEHHLLVVSSADLEQAVRNVLSELLAEQELRRKAEEEERRATRISRAEASKRLRKDWTTLYRWERAGMLHPIKVGRTVYYREAEIRKIEEGRL